MLKSSKLSHKSHKSSKDSAMRKSHLSKKTLRSRSPVRLSGSSRPPPGKPISPGMKRGHPITKRKASHSPRLRSIASSPHRSLSHRKPESPASIDRVRSMKSLKYDKRKHVPNSPVRHLDPSSPRRSTLQQTAHNVPPYHAERYQSSNAIVHSSQYPSPTRKKARREAEHYFASRSVSASPPHRHMADPLHPENHIPHRIGNTSPLHHKHRRGIPLVSEEREKHSYSIRNKHGSPPVVPRTHSKDVALKGPYPSENNRYRSPSPATRYLPEVTKSYGPTLHERFSSVVESNRTEPRIRYSREDLQKITIDIKGNLRDRSPALRHVMNPAEMKLVRRPDESHRPIFDREEIKQASRDLRDDAYYDRRPNPYTAAVHNIDLREVENYQITRHRYESHVFASNSGRTLNDRWQNHDGKKPINLDRDERDKEYAKIPAISRNYIETRSRSRSGDHDFRSERYLDAKPSTSRTDYPSRPPLDAVDSRNSNPYPHRKSTVPVDARHKLNIRKGDREGHPSSMRSEVKDHYLSRDRHYPEPVLPPRAERREYHSPPPEPHKWDYKSRSPSREKFSDYPRRPDNKYGYKSWAEKPDIPPKSTHYLEPESREGSSSFRGSSRPFHSSRGFRTRGLSRGSTFHRGSFRGGYRNSISPRSRGAFRR